MRGRTIEPWEAGFQSIIELYAAVADDLFLLDPSTGSGPDPLHAATLSRINDGLNRGQTVFNGVRSSSPRRPDLEVTRFRAYKTSTTVIFELLHLYYDTIPLELGQPDMVQVRARELASIVRDEYPPWFLASPEIAVMTKSNSLDMSAMLRNMAERSLGRVDEWRAHLNALAAG
jgi:hypothetical protein